VSGLQKIIDTSMDGVSLQIWGSGVRISSGAPPRWNTGNAKNLTFLCLMRRREYEAALGACPDFEPWRLNLKALLCAATFAILVATPVLGADSVSLVGTWTGQRDRIAKVEGRRGGLATLVITEQQGNTFVGRLKRSNATGDEDEALWGAFTPGARLMIGSDEEGTYIFDLVDQNTLDYCYSETGASPRSVCARLTRRP
jgi:hypothetical protein